jgi:hypothetical protein
VTLLDANFLAAIQLKVAFHADAMKRCQASLLYAALSNCSFTCGEVLGHLTYENGDVDVTTAGCVAGSLASLGFIVQNGRIKSPSNTRNGSKVALWCINPNKRETIKTWLERNGFVAPERQQEFNLELT